MPKQTSTIGKAAETFAQLVSISYFFPWCGYSCLADAIQTSETFASAPQSQKEIDAHNVGADIYK
jgi:hypothetical protein